MKAFWDSKTVWINGLTSVAAIVGLVVQQNGLLPTAWIGYAVLALAIVNLILRFVTGEPIGLPTPPTATTSKNYMAR